MADRFELAGSRVLLTGATGGIGHAVARALRARGCELILTGRRVDVLEPLAKELDAQSIAADLADAESVRSLLAGAGRIDVLVANAALPASGPLLEYTPEQIHRALTVNLETPILMAQHVARAMVERGRGHIVLVGSISGLTASPGTSLYNTTKFGLRGFALAFRQDLKGTGVGVSIVEPGFVRDAGMFVEGGGTLPRGARTSSPEECAAGVVRAIERDKGEVIVAPVEIKLGAKLGSVAPELSGRVQRAIGGDTIDSLVEGQRDKR